MASTANLFKPIINQPTSSTKDLLPQYVDKWFKIHFSLAPNTPHGEYQLVLGENHRTELLYSESSRHFYSVFYLPYEHLTDIPLALYEGEVAPKQKPLATYKININEALPEANSPVSWVEQYQLELEPESRKAKIYVNSYFTLHVINYSPLSYTTFDLITDLKPASRLSLFDKQDYLRIFVYATSKQYQTFISKNQQLKAKPESLQSFQEDGYLLYITQLTDEQTRSAQFPFIEFDTALLQFANNPTEALNALQQGVLPPLLPMLAFDDAVYLRFVIRNDRDEVLAIAQDTIPALIQPFASMQRTSARELAPITVHTIGSNRLQQRMIYNHHVLNTHERLDEPSVSQFNRLSRSRGKSSSKKSKLDSDDPKWNPRADQSEQAQHRFLKHPTTNPTIPTTIFEDINTRDKTIQSSRSKNTVEKEFKSSDGLIRRKFGANELPLYEVAPALFSAGDKASKPKTRGSIHVLAMAHYHLPTMMESFVKNNVVLKPSLVLDYYSDENRNKPELDKTVDICENIMGRLDPFFSYRRLPHTQAEVDEFFGEYYKQFGKPDLIDPEVSVDRAELQKDYEPGEPSILRNLEPAGIPLTLLNITPPPNLTPARDLSTLPQYKDKFAQLQSFFAEKYPNKPELHRYEFNNIMKSGNNAYPTPHTITSGINRRGIACVDNNFHRQIVRDGIPQDEYSCDLFDARRAHPLLDLNVAKITPYVDYPLSVENVLYYCRALRTRLRSSQIPLPEDYAQRKQDKASGRMKSNDNNTGVGGKSTAAFVKKVATEIITRTIMDVERKVYQTKLIEYNVVFIGGYRGSNESKELIQKYLREYLSMLPVSFVFIEYNETTTQREQDGFGHTNGASNIDLQGVNLLNETGMVTTQASKFYAVQDHDSLSVPNFTYDRRNISKLQQEYLYPQRDMIISLKKTWFLDKDDNVIYDYERTVLPQVKKRIALQVKQYLDIQFKSRATFDTISMILYPSMSGVHSAFAIQTVAPMTLHTQCGLYQTFFEANDAPQQDSSSSQSKRSIGDEKKAHTPVNYEDECAVIAKGRCPCCQVYDTTLSEATDWLFSNAQKSAQTVDCQNELEFQKYAVTEYTASSVDEGESNTFMLTGNSKTNEPAPVSADHIIDTSAYTIKLQHIATPATVRDVTNSMQWHIENLALKIAQFKEQQGL